MSIGQSNGTSRDLLNGARIDMANALSDLRAASAHAAALGRPDLSYALERAVTDLAGAVLWADKANAELPPR